MQKRSIIKGRYILAAVCVLLIAALSYALLPNSTAGTRAAQAAKELNDYRFDLKFVPEEQSLSVSMTLSYRNMTGETLQTLVLRTWANAYQSEAYSPAAIDEVYDACYPEGFSEGRLLLEGVWWNGKIVSASYLDAAQTVLSVPVSALSPNERGTLQLNCRVQIPHCAHRFGYSEGVWQFGNALPLLSVYENGAWRQEPYCPIGDPFVSECANYAVSLTVPDGWQCAAGGRVTKDGGTYRITAQAVRDFAFAVSRGWKEAKNRANGVEIFAYATEASAAKRAAKCAAKAVKAYERLYGEYPYETLTVCGADFPLGGMEYPAFMLIDQAYFYKDWEDTLELVIAHETAHQWFYALVGSDQYYAAWQDEALSEWAMLQYAKACYGRSAYENLLASRVTAPLQERILSPVTPGSPIDYFGTFSDYAAVVYGRGAALMTAIDEMTGKTNDFLRTYCEQYAFSIASREDFASCLNEWSGLDLSPLILDYIDTYMN